MSQNKQRPSDGFTLIEVLIIAPIVILAVGGFIALMVTMIGNVLVTRDESTLTYDTQSALDRIEQDTRLSTQFLVTTGTLSAPQGSDSGFTGSAAFTNTNALLLSGLATDKNPTDATRWLVYRANQPNPCGSNQRYNRPFLTKIIYFINNGSLWRRTILPNYNTNPAATADAETLCSTPWQKNSCSLGYVATRCQTNDEEIVKNVTSLNVQYYSDPSSTIDLGISGALNASTINTTISTAKMVAGRNVAFSGSVRVTKLNSIDTTQIPPAAPVVTHTLSTPNSVEFSWLPISDATAYQVGYKINGGEWINQTLDTSTTRFTVNGDRTDVISFRASSFNAAGLSAYGNDSATLPTWSLFNLQSNWTDFGGTDATHAFTKTKESIVILKGSIKSGTATPEAVIGTLPVGYRPAQRLAMYTTSYHSGLNALNSGVGRVDILPNGEIRFMEGTNTWISLSGIHFVTSDAPYTWSNLTYQNGWSYFGSGATLRATKDVSTRVHLEGYVRQGTTTTGTTIANLPAGFSPSLNQRFPSNGSGTRTFNAYSVFSTNTLNTLGFNNTYLSIQAMYYPAAFASWTNLTLQSSWSNLGSGNATAQYTKSSDGIVTVKGVIRSGSITNGAVIAQLPTGYRPTENQIFGSVANNAYGRLDVLSSGNIVVRIANATSTSLDSISFMAEQ